MAIKSGLKISAVLFDYGMVLSGPPDPAARQQMQRITGADEGAFGEAYWRFRDAYDRGALNGLAYWSEVAKELGVSLDDARLKALIDADTQHWAQPNEPMIAWAASLQRAGIKTGILSNIGDAMETGIRGRFLWLEAFDHHTFSHRLGIAKPDLEIYRHAVEGLGVPAGEILFIDDREENILAARTAGMVAVQYSSHGAFVQEMKRLGLEGLLFPATTLPAPEA
jgi:putative hydrolase of the HAD superfamily